MSTNSSEPSQWSQIYSLSNKFCSSNDDYSNLGPSELGALYFYNLKNEHSLHTKSPYSSISSMNHSLLLNKLDCLEQNLSYSDLLSSSWHEYYEIRSMINQYEAIQWIQGTLCFDSTENTEKNHQHLISFLLQPLDEEISPPAVNFFHFNSFFNNKIAILLYRQCEMESNLAKISSLGGAFFLSKRYDLALYYAKLHSMAGLRNNHPDVFIKGLIFISMNYYLMNKKKRAYALKSYILETVEKDSSLTFKMNNQIIAYLKWFDDQQLLQSVTETQPPKQAVEQECMGRSEEVNL